MFQNRFSHLDSQPTESGKQSVGSGTSMPPFPLVGRPVSVNDIYAFAQKRAIQDVEIDRLFNPEYYESGGGI